MSGKGVTSSSFSRDYIVGEKIGRSFIEFTFEEAETSCPDGFNNIRYWKKSGDKWQEDTEIEKSVPENKYTEKESVLVMLILDCSSSLGDSFHDVKEGAKEFIRTMVEKYRGGTNSDEGIYLGVIGFNRMENTDRMIMPVKHMTERNEDDFINFIDNFKMAKGTSLYYAMDKGIDEMKKAERHLPELDKDAHMIIFTDGFDNTSINELGPGKADETHPYYQFIKNERLKEKIKGKEIKSQIIAYKGDDISNPELWEKILKSLTYNPSTDFNLADNYELVKRKFEEIAKSLVKTYEWINLICYAGASTIGEVIWTLGEGPKLPGKPYIKASKTYIDYIRVYWDKVSYAEKYKIYRSDTYTRTLSRYKYIKTTSSSGYIDKDVKNQKDYWYIVVAVNDYGETKSNVAKGTTVAPPPKYGSIDKGLLLMIRISVPFTGSLGLNPNFGYRFTKYFSLGIDLMTTFFPILTYNGFWKKEYYPILLTPYMRFSLMNSLKLSDNKFTEIYFDIGAGLVILLQPIEEGYSTDISATIDGSVVFNIGLNSGNDKVGFNGELEMIIGFGANDVQIICPALNIGVYLYLDKIYRYRRAKRKRKRNG